MLPPPPISTLFPYTTLFRSPSRWWSLRPSAGQGCCWASADLVILSVCRRDVQLHVDVVASRIRIGAGRVRPTHRSEEHTSELQSRGHLVCRLLLEKKNHAES